MTTHFEPTGPANPYLSAPAPQQDAPAQPEKRKLLRSARKATTTPPKDGTRSPKRGRRVGVDNAPRKATKATRDVLGFQAMLPTGVAWLGADEWSITIAFTDVTYLAADADTQEAILDDWAGFLNSVGAGARLQTTILNRVLDDADLAALIEKREANDHLDPWRQDFNKIIRSKIAAAAGNTVTEKYLTLTVQEPDQETAEATLLRVGAEATEHLRRIEGCEARVLTRAERLEVISHMLRPHELFTFTEEEFEGAPKRQGTADFVAPWAIERTAGAAGPLTLHNGSGPTWHATLWVRDYGPFLSDRLFAELADVKTDLTISLHIEPFDQAEGLSMIQRQIAEMEMQTIAEQKRAKKQGLGIEFVPHRLTAALDEAKELRAELQQSNQKVFRTILVVGVSAPTKEALEQNISRAQTVIRKMSCVAELTSFMQLEALTTELPVGRRALPMRRTLTTASAAILLPFTTQEIFTPGGAWYGTNTASGNPVVANRATAMNGNAFILGTSGSGKGMAGKLEIQNVLLDRPNDDVIIIDPEHEYERLVEAFGGTIARIHAGSPHNVNPLDIDFTVDMGEGDPVLEKVDFLLSMLDTLIGGKHGLTPKQRSLIDRCAVALYRRHREEVNTPMPTLDDLRRALEETGDEEGRDMATSLELYTLGSLSGFSAQTNVDAGARLMSWDISRLGSELRTFGMMVILDQIWTRVARNRARGVNTWLYVDEFHFLFANPFAASYFQGLFKRGRKWGLLVTGVTQNIEELLVNDAARLMLANSDFLMLLRQTPTDADAMCQLLHLSPEQRRHFTTTAPGCGLLKTGNAIVPIDGRIPTDSASYKLISTKFGEE